MDIPTDKLTLEESVKFVFKKMLDDGIVVSNKATHIAQSLIQTPSEAELAEISSLKSIDIEVEQAEYIQTLGQGWAYPLNKFMDELQLLEVMQMKTLTDSNGKKHLFSVPITQHVTKEQKEALQGEKRIALRCPQVLNGEVLAVIENPVFFENRKEEISTRFFGTFSHKHPKIERILAQGDFLVSGSSMKFVRNVEFGDGLDQYRQTPAQIHEQIQKRNADAVYAF